jgi:hypothetical protein
MRARWIPVLLMATMAIPGLGRAQSQSRFRLTPQQVASVLTEKGIATTGEISLPATVVANVPSPVLDVVSIEPIAKGQPAQYASARFSVRLACRQPGACLPFYATVTMAEPTLSAAANPSSQARAAGKMMLNEKSDITMPAGTHATLVMDDHRSHIELEVISLENGMAGDRIRVAGPNRKQIYVGEVVNGNLLRGTF